MNSLASKFFNSTSRKSRGKLLLQKQKDPNYTMLKTIPNIPKFLD